MCVYLKASYIYLIYVCLKAPTSQNRQFLLCSARHKKIRMAISLERKELSKNLVSKRSDFLGLLRLSKKELNFCIFLDFWLFLGNKKSYRRSAAVKTIRFSRAFQIFKKIWNLRFLDLCIFLWIFGYIPETKRTTGDPLVLKPPDL